MSPRVYERKFDWDEAARLYGEGRATVRQLADRFGVTDAAIRLAVNPEKYAKAKARAREWQRDGRCPGCGARTTRHNVGQARRCKRCAALVLGTSARDGELRCVTCRQWLPDSEFPSNRTEKYVRRGRHEQCRHCQTEAKRGWRARNPGHEAATLRAYRAQKRAA